jgi:BASS family bile acid:Na+ symporter
MLVVIFALIPFARVATGEIFSIRRSIVQMLAWQQLLLPAIVVSVGIVANLPDYCMVIAVVAASSGSLFASPALAEMLNLDRRRALQGMVLSTLFTPITLYAFLNLFRDAAIHVSLAGYLNRIIIFLVVPFALFGIYRIGARYLSRNATASIETGARFGTILALVVFCVGIMHAVSFELAHNPLTALIAILAATTLCAAMMALTTIVFWQDGPSEALTCGLLSGFRNVGLGYALVGDTLGHELAVYVGATMLPMFIAPFVLRAICIWRQDDGTALAAA